MSTSAGTARRTFPSKRPLFYYITDRRQLAFSGRKQPSVLRRAIRRGVDFIQIRERDLPDRDLYELASLAVHWARGTDCRILINSRADIALAAGAHGVHLPVDGLPVVQLRAWLPPGFLIGVSVHSRAEAIRAHRAGADYVLLGHVFPTPSKAGYGPPLGITVLRQVCRSVRLPVLALGGIGPENIDAVLDAGAAGVAGIRLFQSDLDFRVPDSRQSHLR